MINKFGLSKHEFRQKENCSLEGCKLQKSFIHFFQLLSYLQARHNSSTLGLPMPTYL